MNQEEFEQLTNRYVEAEKEYSEYLDRFVPVSWEGEKPRMPEGPLTKEVLERLKSLRLKADELDKEWMSAITKLTN